MFDLAGKRVFVAGHRGMVGSAIVRRLARRGLRRSSPPTAREVDLRRQAEVEAWMDQAHGRDVVVLAAAKVGGILANDTLSRPTSSTTI